VTSSGQLICIGDKTLKYYKEYKDYKNYFSGLCNDASKLSKGKIWELLEEKEEGSVSIVPQNAAELETPFPDNKVVLLYLEDDEKITVHILLIDETDMWQILKCTCIEQTHCLDCLDKFPEDDEDLSIFDEEDAGDIQDDAKLYDAVHKKFLLKPVAIRRF